MNEMTIKIEIPGLPEALAGLTRAITSLADAFGASKRIAPVSDSAQSQADAVPTAAPTVSVPLAAAPEAPAVSAPAPAAPAVPVTGAPAYTLDQISYAGATLVDSGKMEQLLALLARYEVQAVTQLAPEQYGAFATELRALGAQI